MGWDDDVEGSCLNPAVEVNVGYLAGSINSFTFFLLAMFPLVLSRKVDTIRIFRLPFLMLSISTTVAGVLSIIKMYERSRNGIGRSYSSWSWTVTLLGVLVQNIAIVAANILPITQLLSRRPEHITLGSSSDTELHDRISTDNSSIMRVKRSATLTKRPSIRNRPSDRLNRKPSAQAHKGNENTEFGAVEVEAIRKPADALVASTGIMKTTTIHVVEVREGDEDGGRTPVRGHTKAKTSTSDGWKDVLSGSPP
ncbi:Fc.00g029200.m01.CDS01 [Cosmosporella sp. VM-42]